MRILEGITRRNGDIEDRVVIGDSGISFVNTVPVNIMKIAMQ